MILAAGAGKRMGGPKALLEWEGRPLARAHAEAALAAGSAEVFVVVRAPIRDRIELPEGARFVVSDAPDELGPAGSIAAFVAELRPPDERLLAITPVDVPPGAWRVLRHLVDAIGDAAAARPTWTGRRGHPALVRARIVGAQTISPRPLRDLLRELGPAGGVVDVEVDVPDAYRDLDVPGDLIS